MIFNLPLSKLIYLWQNYDFQFTSDKPTVFNLPHKATLFNLPLTKLRFSIYLWQTSGFQFTSQSYSFQFISDKVTIFNLPLIKLRFSIYLWQTSKLIKVMHFNLPLTKYGFQFTPVKAMNFGLHVEVIISLSKLRQRVIDWLIYLCDVDHFQFTFQSMGNWKS